MNKIWLAPLLIAVLIGCGGETEEAAAPAPPKAAAPASTSGSGALSGTILFDGDAPAADEIQMGADPSCARMHPDAVMTELVVVSGNGGLKNVFVYVKEGLEGQSFDVPEEAVMLDQQGCIYTPHVLGIRAGQTLTIRNSDETLHNIHAMPKNNKEFNVGQPVKGLTTDRAFDNPEVMVPFKCDVHKWMAAYVGVLDHPFFAVTDADGSYAIEGLPAGDYVVEAWHEQYGTQQMNVSVGAGRSLEAELFEFSE